MRDLESHLQNLKTNPLTHSLTGVGLPYAAKQKTKQAKQTYKIPDTKANNKKPTIPNQIKSPHLPGEGASGGHCLDEGSEDVADAESHHLLTCVDGLSSSCDGEDGDCDNNYGGL